MRIVRGCRLHAEILTELANDDPALEGPLLYVAQEWLTLATLREQLNARADRAADEPPAQH
jgi:hypothetical protein